MTDLDEKLSAQLCAWMDGELPADEARFLERRLANDPALRAKWERLQLAGACLRNQPVLPLPADFASRVGAAIAAAPPPTRRAWHGWAVAASLAAVALALTPRLLQGPGHEIVASAVRPAVNPVPSPASADLVAVRAVSAAAPVPEPATPPTTASPAEAAAPVAQLVARTRVPVSTQESPLPLDQQSPTDFPLVDNGEKKSWPRSPLGNTGSDPAMEAYLVRHNQMMADDGLGGFVPYVDVVANSPTDAATVSAEGDDGQ